DSSSVPGVSFYKELTGFVDNPSMTFQDPITKGAYFYDGNTFWTGESAASIQAKADYQHCNGLAGAMVYSLEADPNNVLVNKIINATNGSASTCTGGTGTPSPTGSRSPSRSPSPSPTGTRTPTPTPTGTGGGGCTLPAWNASTAYVGGQQVSYVGHNWTAKWWTQGDIPGNNSQGVWTDNGPCGGGGGGGGTGNCAGLFAWNSGTAYNGGQSVLYNGHKWTA